MNLDDVKQPFEVNDFSGGISDDVYLQNPTNSKELDNFTIKSDKSLDSRAGSEIDDLVNFQIPAGIQRIGTLINYNNSDKMFVHSNKRFYYRNPSAYSTLQGPTSNDVLSTGNTTNVVSHTQWNGHLYITSDAFPRPQKIYKDSGGVYRVRTSGLPALATSPVVTIGAAGANDYIYSFHYEYTYTVGSVTFQDLGAVTQVSVTASSAPDLNANAISVIPVIANGSTDNWDTTVIKVFIYRTLAGGQDSYKIGEVTNGTTTFNDNFSDASIETNDRLYIDDGTLDFDPVPLSKFVHVVNNTGYYAHIKDGSEEFKNLIRQSIPGDPDSCPLPFEIEVEDFIEGLSSTRSVPIVFCKRHIYRIEGGFDAFGRGIPIPVRISDTAGCVSNSSIVQTDVDGGSGLFWFGNDGVYFSDGFRTLKVSDGINERYKLLLETASQTNRIYGRFDEKERRVYWCVQKDASSLDNDSFLILDLRSGINPEMPFTTASGASFRPTAIEFFNGSLYRADTRGYVFIHDDAYTTDPKVDTAVDADEWNKETIIWNYESINYNFGSTHNRKYVPKILLTAANRDNTSIQINAVNDAGRSERFLKLIRWRRNFVWGEEEFVWGSPDCVWDATGIIEQYRRMPAKGLRLSYLKIQVTNGFSVIVNSDAIGTATFNNAANTVTLTNSSTQDWPLASVDYVVKTEVDGYVKEYTVVSRTNDVLTVTDSDGTLPTGVYKWELWGYKKGEPLNLLSYNIYWQDNSQTQMTYETGQDGANT